MARKASPQASGPEPPVDLPVSFKAVFWVTVALTVLSLATAVFLATRPADMQTDAVKKLVETCDTTWKMGFGGILGLLGGKRLPRPLRALCRIHQCQHGATDRLGQGGPGGQHAGKVRVVVQAVCKRRRSLAGSR
jgi:hypothetical protein